MHRTILLPIDLNHESSWRKALPTVLAYVRAFGSELHLITVMPDFGVSMVSQFFPRDFESKALAEADRQLRDFIAEHVPEDVAARPIVGCGTVYEEILSAAKRIKADLIVVAAHRPELKDYLLGPNAARIVRHAACSVLVVRE